VNGGKTRALAVTSKSRVAQFPNVPTMSEAGVPGCEATTFTGCSRRRERRGKS
jgi:tripartite-type tricarboxylate transporter receptor subunit TctC